MHRDKLLEMAKTPAQRVKERYRAIIKIRRSKLTHEKQAKAIARIGEGARPEEVLRDFGLM